MTFLSKLKAHIGGLIRIKTQLYWYKTGKWNDAESVYLLLDAIDTSYATITDDSVQPSATTRSHHDPLLDAAVLLFIDGAPAWVWLYQNTAEIVE